MTSRIRFSDAAARAGAPPSLLVGFAAALLASLLLLGGCNTIEGIGDDAEEAGEEVEDAID